MHLRFFRLLGSAGVLGLLVPLTLSAATVAETMTVPDASTVNRGEFVKAAVDVLRVPVKEQTQIPYKRVPKNLLPAVKTAYGYDALKAFGNNLQLAKPVTRGEAVQVLVKLKGFDAPKGRPEKTFRDVPASSNLEDAVRLAIDKGWIEPVRVGFFGTDQVLTGKDARLLLRKVIGEKDVVPSFVEDNGQQVQIRFKVSPKKSVGLPKDDLLKAVWEMLNEQFLYPDKISTDDAGYGAVDALVKSLNDPYTTFMPPLEEAEFQQQLQGEVTGIGAQVEFKNNILTVIAPLPGSPAQKAGLQPGDQILSVNGESLTGLSLLEAVAKVRGPKGTTANLHIRRNSAEIDVPVTRDVISVPELDISYQGDIAIVRIIQFGNRTENELRSLLKDAQLKSIKGVVLDLRNNPGGLLEAAKITLSNFLPLGTSVAHIAMRDSEYMDITEEGPTINADVPMAVLINKGSASASEIVAGALQDHKRATVIGEKSFGKGTVQQVVEFRDGSGLKMTIAEWFTPLRRKIDGLGIEPDIGVLSEEGSRDAQLLRALEVLR